MLRACRRVLWTGGRIAFTTIEIVDGLSATQRRKVREAGPRAAATRSPYRRLLESVRFTDIQHRDITDDYLATAREWLHQSLPRRDALTAVEGAQQVEERIQGWQHAIHALEAGWLRRTMYTAQRPSRPDGAEGRVRSVTLGVRQSVRR